MFWQNAGTAQLHKPQVVIAAQHGIQIKFGLGVKATRCRCVGSKQYAVGADDPGLAASVVYDQKVIAMAVKFILVPFGQLSLWTGLRTHFLVKHFVAKRLCVTNLICGASQSCFERGHAPQNRCIWIKLPCQ